MTPDQLINAKLQKLENEISGFHRMTLAQLSTQTGIPESTWSAYLQKEEVKQRIHNKVNEDIEIAHRAALNALAKEAQKGNVQAIKELNNLSGILNQNKNRQIVTHYIPRSREQRIKQIMQEQDWSREDAEEWYDYNEQKPNM